MIRVEATEIDSAQKKAFASYAKDAEKRITAFFGGPFRKDVVLQLCPSRVAFDQALNKQWGMPKTEPWMIGAAGAERAFFLSPRAWATEAKEHRPDDRDGTRMVVAHELTHSYHAQNNKRPDLDGLDDMAWFIEGLATYVSGQLESRHKGQAKQALSGGKFPSTLKDVWTGQYRYGLAGSLAQYVDAKFGRKTVVALLAATSNEEALKMLAVSEEGLIAGWKEWVGKAGS